MADDNDYPIRAIQDMMKAARQASDHEEALWSAMELLEKIGGYIILPDDDYDCPVAIPGGFRPDLTELRKTYMSKRAGVA